LADHHDGADDVRLFAEKVKFFWKAITLIL